MFTKTILLFTGKVMTLRQKYIASRQTRGDFARWNFNSLAGKANESFVSFLS